MESINAAFELLTIGLYLVGNALLIFGVSKLFDENMIFGFVVPRMKAAIGETWSKPLFLCPPCMSSVWGTLWFALFVGQWILLPVYLILLVGLVRFMMNLSPDWW